MTKAFGALAALGALTLLPSFGATAPNATPNPAATAVPCGFVSFIPAGAPHYANGTAYERIKVTVNFLDGHIETAEFPYLWTYPNGEETDPWSATNLRREDFAVPMQLPPAGTDVKTFAPLLQYVIAHTGADGYTDLKACSPGRFVPEIPSPLDRALRAATGPPVSMWLTFVDDTPRSAPVAIVDATTYALDSSTSNVAHVVRECVTFWNRSPRTVTAIRFAFSYFDPDGKLKTIQPLNRFGSVAPGVVVEGFHRGHLAARDNAETLKSCRMFVLSGETRANHVAVTAVEFIDHTVWPLGLTRRVARADAMKIAITGAAGTIGKPLSEDLARDHEIVRIDLRDADVIADVQDVDALERAFTGCETVIHLAGVVSVEASWDDVAGPNIGGTYAAFEAARRARAKRVIFASSNHAVGMHEVDNVPAIYAPGFGLVVRTDTPYRPDSLYGVWKAFGETLGRYYSDNHGLQVTCVRIGSITTQDDPRDPSVAQSSGWLPLTEPQKFARYAATWMSQRDFARLVRAIIARDVAFAIVYGVGDNATRFWDLEPGRAIFDFWPQDGTK